MKWEEPLLFIDIYMSIIHRFYINEGGCCNPFSLFSAIHPSTLKPGADCSYEWDNYRRLREDAGRRA